MLLLRWSQGQGGNNAKHTPPLWPTGQRPVCFKSSPKPHSRVQLLCLPRWRLLRNKDTSHDAAGFVQPERTARPAGSSDPRQSIGRKERDPAAATGPLHVFRHHPAAGMHAPATRSSTALPVRTRTLKRSSTYLSCRVQANNWSPASRNVWGNALFENQNE